LKTNTDVEELKFCSSLQVILHIVNHLNHFPLAAGAARLTSIVNENQDNPYCTEQQELTAAVFSSPNVQVSYHYTCGFLYKLYSGVCPTSLGLTRGAHID
jgi:hypothetical protein